MWRVAWIGLLAGLVYPAVSATGQAKPTWELTDDGRWPQVAPPTTAPVSDETLDRVEQMIEAGQASAARRIVVAWIRSHKDSPIRDRAVFLLGQANFAEGRRIHAFYNFDEVLDLYPGGRYYYPALQRQYDIADAYLQGYKNRLFGIWPILGATTEATEMLYRIQQRAPGSPLAEKALLRVADYYYANGDYDFAADAYAHYVRRYPRSPYLPRVRLRQAFSELAQFRGVKFDATHIVDARRQLLDLMEAYPRLADEENLTAIVGRIDAALAKKLATRADFYRRTDKPSAAVYYWQQLVLAFPNSPEAEEAKLWLDRMPQSAFEVPQPPRPVGEEGQSAHAPAASPTNRESR